VFVAVLNGKKYKSPIKLVGDNQQKVLSGSSRIDMVKSVTKITFASINKLLKLCTDQFSGWLGRPRGFQ
jgi:hypothetical protein